MTLLKILVVAMSVPSAHSFAPAAETTRHSLLALQSSNDPNPSFPTQAYNNNPPESSQEETSNHVEGQANTRFSAFAPDINLDANDFRSQLKENMKADLERRRKEDPNRGNQPAKSYLDSL